MVSEEYWNETKQKGDIGEDRFKKLLESYGLEITDKAPDNKSFKDYDFMYKNSKGNELTAEVKTDASKTKNLFIQFERNGKSSGIFLTRADLYVTYNLSDELFYIIKSEQLREAIVSNRYEIKRNNKNVQELVKGVIIPKEEFIKLPGAITRHGRVIHINVSKALDKSKAKPLP